MVEFYHRDVFCNVYGPGKVDFVHRGYLLAMIMVLEC